MKKVNYIVKLALDKISPSDLLVKARNMVRMMTANPAYASPIPALADVSAACTVLEATINAYELNAGPGEHLDRGLAFGKMKGLITALGAYVQAASNGDLELIKSAGCVVRKPSEPIGELPAPKAVVAEYTDFPGRIEVRWGGVRGRSMYELEGCMGNPMVEGNWRVLTLTSKNRFTATGLESGVEHYFRVKAIGAAGASPLSDSAHAMAA